MERRESVAAARASATRLCRARVPDRRSRATRAPSCRAGRDDAVQIVALERALLASTIQARAAELSMPSNALPTPILGRLTVSTSFPRARVWLRKAKCSHSASDWRRSAFHATVERALKAPAAEVVADGRRDARRLDHGRTRS